MAPYRSAREERTGAAAPLPGPVADMVQQFADPYAFLRELVQNSVDAGAHQITVRIEVLPEGRCATSVIDDGSGMTSEEIEGPLLTLFSSSKESDPSKIGKYGVGFVSVFAVEPERVDVETARSGRVFRVHLRGDGSYELEDAGAREGCGTRVTLLQRMHGEAFATHVRRSRTALRRWCRHVDRRLDLCVVDRDPGDRGSIERIDEPLSVWAPVVVTATVGDTTYVVGPSAGTEHVGPPSDGLFQAERAASFAGFYNRGLTLFETSDEVYSGLSGVRFKVMSPRFQHTLSRDNVRRDDAFQEALARVRELVKGPLRRELAARLAEAAAAASEGRRAPEHAALLTAATSAPTALDRDHVTLPLASPLDGERAATARALRKAGAPLLTASARDALTDALARSGRPVVLAGHPALPSLLKRCFPRLGIEDAHDVYLLVREVPDEGAERDAALLRAVGSALARAQHPVASVRLCVLEGALRGRAGVLLPAPRERGGEPRGRGDSTHAGRPAPRLCSEGEVVRAAARWPTGHVLYLNVKSETVRRARARAAATPEAIGTLLARALLVEAQGPLGPEESDRLLDLGAPEGSAR